MITVKLVGGLGNQLRGYCAGAIIARELEQSLTLDVSEFYHGYFRMYLLDYLNIPETVKLWYSLDVPAYTIVVNLPQSLRSQYDVFINIDDYSSRDDVLNAVRGKRNVYLYGYDVNFLFEGIDLPYLKKYIRPKFDNSFLSYFSNHICQDTAVSVHIRRTDFVGLNWSSDKSYLFYRAAMNYIRSSVSGAKFYIFSDDVDWTKKHFLEEPDCVVIDTLGGEVQSLYDMFCMAKCKHHILTRKSTYSIWASLLSEVSGGLNICQEDAGGIRNYDEYANLDVTFFDDDMIAKYVGDLSESAGDDIHLDTLTTEDIEQALEDGDVMSAFDKINEISFGSKYDISSQRDKLLECRALGYFINEEYAFSLDSFRAYRSKKPNYDFVYNYAITLECLGKHLEALCYATVAKNMNADSDIDNVIVPYTEDEAYLSGLIGQVYNMSRNGTNIIFMSNQHPDSFIKQISSINALMGYLGINANMWRSGIDSADSFISKLNSKTILVTNICDNCIDSGNIPLIVYESRGYSDIDHYFYDRYSASHYDAMMKASDVYISEAEDIENKKISSFSGTISKNRSEICQTADMLHSWETYVNDDEVIWQMASIMKGIVFCCQ